MPTGTSGPIFCWPAGSGVALRKCRVATPSRRGSSTSATAEAPSPERTKVLQAALKIGDEQGSPDAAGENGDGKCQQTKADYTQSASSKRALFLHPPPQGCCVGLRLQFNLDSQRDRRAARALHVAPDTASRTTCR